MCRSKGLCLFLDRNICKTEHKSNIKVKSKHIILGYSLDIDDYLKYKDINNIILVAKDYIWNCRKYRTTVSVKGFTRWVADHKQYDKSLEKFFVSITTE